MKSYGIGYKGSKNLICEQLISVLPCGNRFVDLFGGGFAITHCAISSGKWKEFLFNEVDPQISRLIDRALNGNFNYENFTPYFITKEDFLKLKDKDPYVKFVWSFGNIGRTYMFGKDKEVFEQSVHNFIVFKTKNDYLKENFNDIEKYVSDTIDGFYARRFKALQYFKMKGMKRVRLIPLERIKRLQQLEHLDKSNLKFTLVSYDQYVYQEGDIVYCDPPYEETSGYNGEKFNIEEFYDWVATRPFPVYFSSYNNVSDDRFKPIWSLKKRVTVGSQSSGKQLVKSECLYWNGK